MTSRSDQHAGGPDQLPWHELRWVVVDVEGNGARPPELVELAALPIVGGVVGELETWLVRPPTRISWQATRVHGIRNEDVADARTVSEVRDNMMAALVCDGVIGHNVGIDLGVLTQTLPGWSPALTIDTLRLARAVDPGRDTYRLGALAEAYGLHAPNNGQAHRAGYDTLITAALFMHLVGEMVDAATVERLTGQGQKAQARPSAEEAQGTLFGD